MRHTKKAAPGPSGLEHEILRKVWAHGPLTADTVRELLDRPLKDSTVRTVLRRLEEKGLIEHTVEGRTFVYVALEQPAELATRAVRNIVDRFCGGSLETLLVGLVDGEVIEGAELERLARKIAATKKKGELK
jgi:predicted transcriptional regulator